MKLELSGPFGKTKRITNVSESTMRDASGLCAPNSPAASRKLPVHPPAFLCSVTSNPDLSPVSGPLLTLENISGIESGCAQPRLEALVPTDAESCRRTSGLAQALTTNTASENRRLELTVSPDPDVNVILMLVPKARPSGTQEERDAAEYTSAQGLCGAVAWCVP